jgi:nicotinamide riboside transporter PnuC
MCLIFVLRIKQIAWGMGLRAIFVTSNTFVQYRNELFNSLNDAALVYTKNNFNWYKMGIIQSTKCLTIATKKTPCPMPQAPCLVFRKRKYIL